MSLLLLSFFAQGQGEGNNWLFGSNAYITFNSGTPTYVAGSAMFSAEGTACMSDPQGNLLMYSNGEFIWDATHNLMPNGSGLLGNQSATQVGVIIPKPQSSNIYYLFTLPASSFANGMRYSEIDMSLNGGLGDVTTNKNVFLTLPVTEQITAVHHANNMDYWVLACVNATNTFHAYLVNATGVQTTPIVSGTAGNLFGGAGYMKMSPSGNYLAKTSIAFGQIELYNFDNQTGVVTGPVLQIPVPAILPYGLEFSSDGTKLYAATNGSPVLHQWDLSLPLGNIIASHTTIGTSQSNISALQLGPDKKIYCGRFSSTFLGVIDQPNLVGTACNYIDSAVSIAPSINMLGLPNFIQSFFYTEIDVVGNCLGDTTFFSLIDTIGVDSVFWDFGDTLSGVANTSTALAPGHVFSDTGAFTITAISYASGITDTAEVVITIMSAPQPFSLGNDTTFCSPDTLQLIPGNNPTFSFLWQDSTASPELTADSTGLYWVEVSNNCGFYRDSIQVNITVPPQIDLGPDTGLCTLDSVNLQIGVPGVSYLWSTGSTVSGISVGNSGTYWASTSDSTQCGTSDTIVIEYFQVDSADIGPDTMICEGVSLSLSANLGATSYLWSTGSTFGAVQLDSSGTYWVDILDSNLCLTSDTMNLTVAPMPILDLGADTGICDGESILLEGTPGMSSYLWSSGHTVPDVFVTIADTFWLSVTDSNGCSAIDTIITQINPLPVFSLGPDTTVCEGDSVQFSIPLPGLNYLWSSGETTASVFATTTGIYWATATDANQCEFSDTINLQLMPLPVVNLGGDTLLCQGATYVANVTNPGSQYTWSDAFPGPVKVMKDAGEFWVTVTTGFGCQASDTLEVRTVDLELGPDLEFCEGEQAVLEVPDSLQSVSWPGHGDGHSLVVSDKGIYSVQATYEICLLTDSLEVSVLPFPESPQFKDTILCFEDFPEGLRLKAGEETSTFLWSTGDFASEIQVLGPGIYSVEVTNADQCSITDTIVVEDFCAPSIFFPNSFTPNSDGHNDEFRGYGTNIAEFELLIFNRWGEVVFSGNTIDEGWDGTNKGSPAKQDVYVWVARYKLLNHRGATPEFEAQGRVTLVR